MNLLFILQPCYTILLFYIYCSASKQGFHEIYRLQAHTRNMVTANKQNPSPPPPAKC